MSSLLRRIQRAHSLKRVKPSTKLNFGNKLGVKNPKHPPRATPVRHRDDRRKVWRKRPLHEVREAARSKPKFIGSTFPRTQRDDQSIPHRAKMNRKAEHRAKLYRAPDPNRRLAPVNRHTGKPHAHAREIVRNLRR